MVVRRLASWFKNSSKSQLSSSTRHVDEGKEKSFGRKAVSFVLIAVTGGVALSALDDLSVYQSCSSKAMEKANQSQVIKDAIGEPVKKGPWYNASLAVAQKRHSVSCTFPVTGPNGNGVFRLKAVRNGEDNWLSFLRSRDWDILVLEALLHIPENEGKQQTLRVSLSDNLPLPAAKECITCPLPKASHPTNSENKT
ncbi:hypothetical protein ACFE04_031214 [Oxalis oulophora]